MRPAGHTGAPPELNPEGSPRRDADAGGGMGLPTAGKPGSWVQQQAERWAQLPWALDARLVPPLEVREGCRKPQWPRVGRVWGRCPVSAPVSAGVWQLPTAPTPRPLFCGDCGLCHTLVTGPARHVAVTLCSPRTQASFLRLLRPKRVGAGSKTVPPERCTQLVAPTLIQGRGREDADEQGY